MALYVTRPRRDEERIGRGLPSVAERQEIKGRQSSLVKSRGLPNETTDKMADKFKPELVQCSNKITGYLTDSITHTHILQRVSNTHLCIFLV